MTFISFNELFACTVACIPFLYMGVSSGISTAYIYDQNSKEKLSDEDASWIGGSGLTLSFVGCFLSGFMADVFGRRILFFCTYAIHSIGWMIIATTQYFLIGRILISFAIGMGHSCMVYVAEILKPQHRGAFLSISSTLEIFGSLLVYFAGYYISTEAYSLILSIFAGFLLLCIFFIPESPYWYMLKKKKGKAMKSLIWLRNGNEFTIDYELSEIENSLDNTNKDSPSFVEVVFNLKWWRLLFMFSVYVTLTELTGFDMIVPYSVQFFDKLNRLEIDTRIISMVFITIAFIGTIVTTIVIEKFERTWLVKFCSILNVILLSIPALCETYFNTTLVSSVVSLICFCIFSTSVTITAFTLPWLIISENLPTELRATLFSALGTEFNIVYFLIVKLFPSVLNNVPINLIIWSFAVFSLLNYVFIRFFVKETRGTILPGNRTA